MKMKEHVIYDDYHASLDDYKDLFDEIEQERNGDLSPDDEDYEALTEREKQDIFYDELSTWADAEYANLNIRLDEDVIAIADLGLWYGRRSGYKILSNNVNSIFSVCEDYNIWTCDRYNVRGTLIHHDGTNYVLYRAFKPGLTDEQKERFCDALYNGTCSERMISRYTRSIAPEVKAVYGWR